MFDIRESLKNLPDAPGVYLHKDRFGEILYVGKAASLKNRVRQYFQSSRNMDAKVRAMVSHIAEFEYITTNTETEALILEDGLIKKHMPRYNVLLRDDKTYPYIKITMAEPFPRILKTRILAGDGSKYFGPYADVKSVNRIIDLLCDVYRLKRCAATRFSDGHRACLNRDIGRCDGVCLGGDRAAYREGIAEIAAFLGGRSKVLTDRLRADMKAAAERMDFERAAVCRDHLAAANAVIERQRVVLLSGGDMDIVLAAKGEKNAHVVVFFVRGGRLSGRESHHLITCENEPPAEIVSAFLKQYYINQSRIPKEILVDEKPHDGALIAEWLSGLRGGKVAVYTPARGDKKALLELARRDLVHTAKLLDEKAKTQTDKDAALSAAFGAFLGVSPAGAIWRSEAYDISETGGEDSVGAMVVFSGNRPARQDYRRFRVRTAPGADDYAAMQEVVYRRLKRFADGDAGFSPLPDVILVDGGLGHVNAVEQITRAMKLTVPVAGMVKDDRHRTRGLIYRGDETDMKQNPLLVRFAGTIQEEVHRFAIEYHRKARGKKMLRSELDEIDGIGAKRRNALLTRFGSVERIREADEDALAGTPGMTRAAARRVLGYFKGEGEA